MAAGVTFLEPIIHHIHKLKISQRTNSNYLMMNQYPVFVETK